MSGIDALPLIKDHGSCEVRESLLCATFLSLSRFDTRVTGLLSVCGISSVFFRSFSFVLFDIWRVGPFIHLQLNRRYGWFHSERLVDGRTDAVMLKVFCRMVDVCVWKVRTCVLRWELGRLRNVIGRDLIWAVDLTEILRDVGSLKHKECLYNIFTTMFKGVVFSKFVRFSKTALYITFHLIFTKLLSFWFYEVVPSKTFWLVKLWLGVCDVTNPGSSLL